MPVTQEQLDKVLSDPGPRTWQEGHDELARGFDRYDSEGWWRPASKTIYLELYRALTHGHGLSPDDALATLGAAYHAAAADVED